MHERYFIQDNSIFVRMQNTKIYSVISTLLQQYQNTFLFLFIPDAVLEPPFSVLEWHREASERDLLAYYSLSLLFISCFVIEFLFKVLSRGVHGSHLSNLSRATLR